MADDEQFSLCWNNFNSNLSAGFHESLCRGDLVDVTLAAEGQFVKAHRLVLSVCSPYFRKMFTQMPANQHAFVFLKDVSHTALKDLIQFMYCGEVNVKQEALPAFISTAEALQIKGLTDSDPPPSQSPAEPSTPTPQIQQITSPRVRQRSSTARSYKIETVDDSGDDNKQTTQIVIQTTAAPPQATITQQQHHQTQHLHQQQQQSSQQPTQQQQLANTTATTTHVVSQKRPSRNIASGPHIKRTKSTIDPLDTVDNTITVAPTTQQITVQTAVVSTATAVDSKSQQQQHHHHQQQQQQQQSEPEYIDLPIELPTKSEPDYTEEAGEVESGDHEATYVEDDSYGELRYDESYFTENDDAGNPTATGTTVPAAAVGAAATTSKAIKQQQQQTSFSDSSYVETADQTNSDAQETMRTFQYTVTNCKFDVTAPNESFLPTTSRGANRGAQGNTSNIKIKNGLSKRKPLFLESRSLDDWGQIKYTTTTRGNKLLYFEGHRFIKNNIYGSNVYWKCTKWHSNCKARAITSYDVPTRCIIKGFRIDFIDSKKNGGKLLVINGFRFFRNKKRGSRQYWKCSNYYKEKCPAIAIYDEITLNLRLCHQHKHLTSNDIEIKPFLPKDGSGLEIGVHELNTDDASMEILLFGHGQYSGSQPKIQFSVSKRGGQLLWLDGLKYFRNNENRTNLFWRCHWYYRRIRCPVLICMNKYDATDFRQIHKHCHVKSGKRQQSGSGGSGAANKKAATTTSTVATTTAEVSVATRTTEATINIADSAEEKHKIFTI